MAVAFEEDLPLHRRDVLIRRDILMFHLRSLTVLGSMVWGGCTSYYHVTENNDHKQGWVAFNQLAAESRGLEIEVTMRDSSVFHGTDLEADSAFTAWRELGTGNPKRHSNDSISTISWDSRWRGFEDGVLLSLPVGLAGTAALASHSLGGALFASYILPVYPAVGGIIGALVKHTYRYRYLRNPPGKTGAPQPK